jgi:trk system potassium uptake protein
MNYKIIFRLLGYITAALSAGFLLCLGVALVYREEATEAGGFAAFFFSFLIAAALALGLLALSRHGDTRFFRKEALCVIGLGWILASLVGALPFAFLLPSYTLADAVFESTSGFTTTGASVLSDLEQLPPSLIFWRSLTQWVGGLGVIVFFVAILSFLGAGGKILFSHESSGRSADIEQGRIRQGVLQIFYIYLGMSLSCLLALHLCGMNWYDAACHMFATVSTGGYSTRSASIAAFQSPLIEWVLVFFMALGGTNFFFIILLMRRKWEQGRRNTEVCAYLAMLFCMVFLFSLYLEADGTMTENLHHSIRASAFQVVSIATTTGFGTEDFDQWPLFTKMGLLSLMVIGGCSASTSGGAKVIRLVVALKVTSQSIERAFRLRVVRPVMINGKPLDDQSKEGILNYLVLLTLITLISFPLFSIFETGHSLEGSASAVIACFFNIGPGFAEFGPTQNFVSLTSVGKLYLSLLMIMGRLELFAILALFSPSLWRKLA